jgi:hypothetical protein
VRNDAGLKAVSGECGQTQGSCGVRRFSGGALGALEHAASALFATATASGDAQFELQILERTASLLCMANDIAVRDSVADADNHGAAKTKFDALILNRNNS